MDPSKRAGLVVDRMMQEGNLYGVEKGLALHKGLRDFDADVKFDEFTKRMQDDMELTQRVLLSKGLSGVPDALNDRLKDQGMKAEYKDDKAGGVVIVRKGDEIVGQYRTPEEIMKAVSVAEINMFSQELLPHFRDMGQLTSWLQAKYQARQKDRELNIKAADSASMAGYRQGVLNNQAEELQFNREQFDKEYGLRSREADSLINSRDAQTDALGKTGAPVGTVDGVDVYVNPKGPGLIYGGGEAVAPDAKFEVATTPGATVQQIREVAAGLKGTINPQTNELYTDTEATVEAQKIIKGKNYEALSRETVKDLLSNGLKVGTPEFNEAYNLMMGSIVRPGTTKTEQALGDGGLDKEFGSGTQGSSAENKDPPKSALPVGKDQPAADRLRQAMAEDAKTGNTYRFDTLARDAKDRIKLIEQQLKNIDVSIPKMPRDARMTLEARKAQLQQDLQIYQSILQQKKARSGVN